MRLALLRRELAAAAQEGAVWRFNWTKTDELSSDKTGLPL